MTKQPIALTERQSRFLKGDLVTRSACCQTGLKLGLDEKYQKEHTGDIL